MYPVLTIADEILKSAKMQGRSLTPMQLMKLVYIAHGWSLAVLNRDIFSDRTEAWKYGPIIPSLYQATKQFGRSPIGLDLIDENTPSGVDGEVGSFLEDVVAKYGHLSGIQLSNLTHLPGTPWHQVYEPNVSNKEISDHLIRQHYVAKLNEFRQNSTAASG
ncbi:SocA family protein [Sulfitobacter sp. M57]|uniref:Panacea domain-containing protein n=1 Tax=unclassified Sulfitobacter TaxID=196795 RepID=UPI0023E2821C|nr:MULTISPECIES: type II toxin-antitoxin system antitoxin SocA domain-containing protein [unclassified Sulfitobacter]MDF3413789.1 SocA family protein [Sulfitobacter sp. KE5]MDF3420930.1 SocA family protein [Sulfitobacter sp. KE43]MDF3432335.1 SocA family protein [Sulfitobacter sp. KE42]MDF3457974.1 SocA family protein [Sulfitobacter sp. S74]MDF3461875.1 SocA family protein [Sulfitobacter sp. Ks18]